MDKIKKKQEKRIQKKILQAEEHKRLLKKQCLNCRKRGHEAKNCPDTELIKNGIDQNVQICYNCGRDNHNLKDCRKRRSDVLPFAVCFVCKETGHISRDCPKNDKGMYSKGGGCFICESVRHKASECPNNPVNQKRNGKFIQKKEKKEINNEEVESEVNENAGEELEPEIDEEF